jgi:acyl-coenzyme A synthetase/AMP-(fatty) acid ligase
MRHHLRVLEIVLITMAGEENDWPAEIAERLVAHGAVSETIFVGLHDKKFGEAAACLLRLQRIFLPGCPTTRYESGCLKTHHSRWNAAIGDDIPQAGSGKLKAREACSGAWAWATS